MADYDSINNVVLVGRVGRKFDLKRGEKTGMAVIDFSIATNERDQDSKVHTDWHYIKAFGAAAEFVDKYIKIGDRIAVTGKNKESIWFSEGMRRRTYGVTAKNIVLFRGSGPEERRVDEEEEETFRSEEPPQEPDPPF